MGRAFYSTRSSSPVSVSPYPKWSTKNPFDPDSDEFFRDAQYEAFLDTNDLCLPTLPLPSPMAEGDDPAQIIADAFQSPPSPVSSPETQTYIYDIPPTAPLPSLSSLTTTTQNHHQLEQLHELDEFECDSDSESSSDDSSTGTPPPLIRFQVSPQRSQAIPIPTPPRNPNSFSYSPPPSVSPRIYNWARSRPLISDRERDMFSTSPSPFRSVSITRDN